MSDREVQHEEQSRTCFVIMPFSDTTSCTEAEWTQIFNEVIEPAVEAVGYSCRRSAATRGNLIKEIIQDLDASWVVLADLTDRNSNVFYELGVRHALKNRTILIAQNRTDIPFDLHVYANHVYEWKDVEGKERFTEHIKVLLEDVDTDPNRADNPVSDFLESPVSREQPATTALQLKAIDSRLEDLESGFRLIMRTGVESAGSCAAVAALEDASPLAEGEPAASWFDAGVEIAVSENSRELRRIVRNTVRDIRIAFPEKVKQLNTVPVTDKIERAKIPDEALRLESEFAPLTNNVELFTLGLTSDNWSSGAQGVLQIVGSMISAGEGLSGLRFASGLPSYFAWRLILLGGARSMQEEAYNVAATLINSPIPVTRHGGQLTYQSLEKHRDLFYSEALLGYADLSVKQIGSMYERSPHIHDIFSSEEEYQMSLIEFLVLVALRDAQEDGRLLYPGYRLIPGFTNACRRLVSRLVTGTDQLNLIASILNLGGEELRASWSDLTTKANAVEIGSEYLNDNQIPTSLD